MKVRVWNGDQSECLGIGDYDEDVAVYFIHMPDGSLRSISNAEQEPTPDMIPEGAQVIKSDDNPKIVLENGEVVYGCQTWWHPLEREAEIINKLAEVVNEQTIPEWLEKPNESFSGRKPQELLEKGEFSPFLAMIYQLRSGEPSS